MDSSLKQLLPKGEYYEKTSDFFKNALEVSSKNTDVCIENIKNKTEVFWEEIASKLRFRGGNSYAYIKKCAHSFDQNIKVDIEGPFVVKITGVTYHPIIFGGSFTPEIAPEVRYLQKIKPAYMIFKYYDREGRKVYCGI